VGDYRTSNQGDCNKERIRSGVHQRRRLHRTRERAVSLGKDGRPCCSGIVSSDTRAWKYPRQWEQDGTADAVYRKTFQKILACQPVSLLNWMKDNDPEVLNNVKWIFKAKGYIRFRLTCEAWAEITDSSGANLMNLRTKEYDDELLDLFGLSEILSVLPPLKKSTDLQGFLHWNLPSLHQTLLFCQVQPMIPGYLPVRLQTPCFQAVQ